MDIEIAELVRAERLVEAAQLASSRGDPRTASTLYERACEWRRAGAEALRAGDFARALDLAIYGGDDDLARRALGHIAGDDRAARSLAARLTTRGQPAWAAQLLEGCNDGVGAAGAWEQAGEARRAAALFERSGQAGRAARVLEAALRRDPTDWGVAAALGALLGRFGKGESAARALQRVPPGAPQRRDALAALVPVLAALGLAHAAEEARAELQSLGGRSDASSSADPALPSRLFGRYEFVREVASSPGARLLECVEVARGDRVALKLFSGWDTRATGGRDALARFEREVRAMKAIQHPHVVPLREFLPEGPAVVVDWMSGGTLEQRLSAGPLSPARAAEIAAAVLSALGEAHRMGIVHRDVKPGNVLFDEGGAAYIGDFGVAHLGDVSATATAGSLGGAPYLSPEQRQGRPATAQSDLYAVGVMLRDMLRGSRRPASARGASPGLDARHEAVIETMTAHDPALRPRDAFEASALLGALPWPATIERTATQSPEEPESQPPGNGSRLAAAADGKLLDLWTGREIECVPLTEASLARARAFAATDHPALQRVWRVDRPGAQIWLETLRGPPFDRPLTADERRRLAEALRSLHAAGVAHGQVDRSHLVVAGGDAVLRFDPAGLDPRATPAGDQAALARL